MLLQPVPPERIRERLVDVGFIKGLDMYNMPRPGDVMVPVPQIMEAAAEVLHASQECVLNRTPEQLVDEPVPQIAEEIVGPVPLGRIPVPSQRELHEALRKFYEQYAFEEDEEEEEAEYEEEEEISRFPPQFPSSSVVPVRG